MSSPSARIASAQLAGDVDPAEHVAAHAPRRRCGRCRGRSRLARYIAMSASLSSAVVPASPPTARLMPTLAERLIRRPSSSTGRAQASSSASATNATSCSPLTSSHTTTNSSPPSRATVSPSRTTCSNRRRELGQQLVAAAVPERVVDGLEVVEVEQQHRDHAVGAGRPAERVVDPVHHQRAVGQAGQRVVQRLVLELVLQLLPAYGGPQRRGDGLDERDVVLGPVPGVRAGGADDAPGVPVRRGSGSDSALRIPNRVVASSCGNAGRRPRRRCTTSSLRISARPVSELLVEVEHDGHPVRAARSATISVAARRASAAAPPRPAGVAGVDERDGLRISWFSGIVSASRPSSATARCSCARTASARSCRIRPGAGRAATVASASGVPSEERVTRKELADTGIASPVPKCRSWVSPSQEPCARTASSISWDLALPCSVK